MKRWRESFSRSTLMLVAASTSMALASCGGAGSDEASSESDTGDQQSGGHFAGETIELVVPFEPGGGYDVYARLIAPELADQLDAEVVVVNEPGAGGLLAANQTWASPPDENRLLIMNTVGVIGSELADDAGVQYEADDFSWIGRVSGDPDLLVTAADGEIQSLEDMLAATSDAPVSFVSTGPGSNEYIDALVLQQAYGIAGHMVTGFEGGEESFSAVVGGDADAQSRSLGSQLPHVENGDATPILVVGSEPVEELPDTPTMLDADVDLETDDAVLEQHAALIESGRTLAGPPDMEADALGELRDAYEAVAKDEEFVAEAEKQDRPIDYMSGEDVATLVDDLLDASDDYVEIVRDAFAAAGDS